VRISLLNGKWTSRRLEAVRRVSVNSENTRDTEFLDEGAFAQRLCTERRRAERYHKCLLLMQLDVQRLLRDTTADSVSPKLKSALSSSTRETDITGWHQSNAVLAVIFTEVENAEKDVATRAVLARIKRILGACLQPEQVGSISISVSAFPEDWDSRSPGSPSRSALYPDLVRRERERRTSRFLKRSLDIVVSTLALIGLSPLYTVIALVIKMTSKGAILFRQERVGQFGVAFQFLKFRTMHDGCNPQIHRDYVEEFILGVIRDKPATFKLKDDPRVTAVGRVLRRTSLDELPQFWNVLKGEMSLVGPRPPIPYELNKYDAWHRRRLLETKPGITGLWQVYGRSRTSFDEMVRLDLRYARSWSLWLDLQILLKTPKAVLSGEGAY
jgi:lipopolysaccharide/colanic/teichoic acid biosynthesis glycosyltransferase